MDEQHTVGSISNASSAAIRKRRRSSILKTQRPPRTPFSELEFNVATPTDATKSRRVSFSRRTGVAEFVTNEATTTWKNFYEEQNKSLESSGHDSEVNTAGPSKLFTQSIDQVFTEQIVFNETTDAKNSHISFTSLTLHSITDNHSKLFKDELTNPEFEEVTGKINMNFSEVNPLNIDDDEDDLDAINRNLNLRQQNGAHDPFVDNNLSQYLEINLNKTHGPMTDSLVSDMSITDTIHSPKVQSCVIKEDKKPVEKDWVEDKENMIINPYVTPAESDNFAINKSTEKVLVFDGKKLKYADINADLDEIVNNISPSKDKTKSLIENNMSMTKGITEIVCMVNEDMVFDRDKNDIDMSLTKIVNEDLDVDPQSLCENMSMTKGIPNIICMVNNSNTCDKNATDEDMSLTKIVNDVAGLVGNVSVPEDNVENMSITKGITNIVCINNGKDSDDSNNIEVNMSMTNVVKVLQEEKDLSNNVSCLNLLPKRQTIVFENDAVDLSMTTCIPSTSNSVSCTEEVSSGTKRKTIVFDNGDKNADMSITEILLDIPKDKTRQTFVFDDSMGDISMTQALPVQIIDKKSQKVADTNERIMFIYQTTTINNDNYKPDTESVASTTTANVSENKSLALGSNTSAIAANVIEMTQEDNCDLCTHDRHVVVQESTVSDISHRSRAAKLSPSSKGDDFHASSQKINEQVAILENPHVTSHSTKAPKVRSKRPAEQVESHCEEAIKSISYDKMATSSCKINKHSSDTSRYSDAQSCGESKANSLSFNHEFANKVSVFSTNIENVKSTNSIITNEDNPSKISALYDTTSNSEKVEFSPSDPEATSTMETAPSTSTTHFSSQQNKVYGKPPKSVIENLLDMSNASHESGLDDKYLMASPDKIEALVNSKQIQGKNLKQGQERLKTTKSTLKKSPEGNKHTTYNQVERISTKIVDQRNSQQTYHLSPNKTVHKKSNDQTIAELGQKSPETGGRVVAKKARLLSQKISSKFSSKSQISHESGSKQSAESSSKLSTESSSKLSPEIYSKSPDSHNQLSPEISRKSPDSDTQLSPVIGSKLSPENSKLSPDSRSQLSPETGSQQSQKEITSNTGSINISNAVSQESKGNSPILSNEGSGQILSKTASPLSPKVGSQLSSKEGSRQSSKVESQQSSKEGSPQSSKLGSQQTSKLESPSPKVGSQLSSKEGSRQSSKVESQQSSKVESQQSSKEGSPQSSKLGSQQTSKLESPSPKVGSQLSSKEGSRQSSKVESQQSSKEGSPQSSKLGSQQTSKLESPLSSKPGSQVLSKSPSLLSKTVSPMPPSFSARSSGLISPDRTSRKSLNSLQHKKLSLSPKGNKSPDQLSDRLKNKSQDDIIPIIEGDIEEEEDNTINKQEAKDNPNRESSSREKVKGFKHELKMTLQKLKKKTETISPNLGKLLDIVIPESNQSNPKRLSLKKSDDTKELLDMISSFTDDKNTSSTNDKEVESIATKDSFISLKKDTDYLNEKTEKGTLTLPSVLKIRLGEPPISPLNDYDVMKSPSVSIYDTQMPKQNKHVRMSDDWPYSEKTDDEKDDPYSYNTLKKTAFGESAYMREHKAKVIPNYLEGVTEEIKELMDDLVKPISDVLPFETGIGRGSNKMSSKKPSFISTDTQANLISSSQIDLESDVESGSYIQSAIHTPVESVYSMKRLSPEQSTESHASTDTIQQRYTNSAHIIPFDRNNPMNNIFLGPCGGIQVHNYNPIHSTESVTQSVASDVTTKNNIEIERVHVNSDFKHSDMPKARILKQLTSDKSISAINISEPSTDQSARNIPESESVIYAPMVESKSIDSATDSRIMELKDTEVNTHIVMKPNIQLLETSSSLTLVESSVNNSEVCVPKFADRHRTRYLDLKEMPEDEPSISRNMLLDHVIEEIITEKNSKKRSRSPITPKHKKRFEPVDLKSPQIKVVKANTPKNRTDKKEKNKIFADGIYDTQKQLNPNWLPGTSKSIKSARKVNTNVTVNHLATDFSNISHEDAKEFETSMSIASDAHLSAISSGNFMSEQNGSFTSSKNFKASSGDEYEPSQMILSPATNDSETAIEHTEGEDKYNVVAKIDMLPFVGTSLCSWDSLSLTSVRCWSFLLMNEQVRLLVELEPRAENALRTRVSASTPVVGVRVESTLGDSSNPIITLCTKMAVESMRAVCKEGWDMASEVPELLRRCAVIASRGTVWTRVMKETRLKLAYTINVNGELMLQIANVLLTSVWLLTFRITASRGSWGPREVYPRAEDVTVTDVVANYSITQAEVNKLMAEVREDWGHVPNTIWKIFNYLKNKTLSDVNIRH